MEPEITVIIIDDDLGSIQKLQNDLLAFSEVRILDTATTAELGKRHILKYQPDLVFLDVELPDMSGFDLLDDIRDDILPVYHPANQSQTCPALICWMIYGMIFFRT